MSGLSEIWCVYSIWRCCWCDAREALTSGTALNIKPRVSQLICFVSSRLQNDCRRELTHLWQHERCLEIEDDTKQIVLSALWNNHTWPMSCWGALLKVSGGFMACVKVCLTALLYYDFTQTIWCCIEAKSIYTEYKSMETVDHVLEW